MAEITNKFIYNTKDAADFFGIDSDTLNNWAQKGAPKEGRDTWDLKALVKWRYDIGKGEASAEVRMRIAEADLKEAKARQEEIKLSVNRSEYVSTSEVQKELTRLMNNLKKSLLAIPHNVASDVSTINLEIAGMVENAINERVSEALTELSEGRLYRAKKGKKKK